MLHRFNWKLVHGVSCVLAMCFFVSTPKSVAQAVPVPIADTPLAGQGASPYCSTNIPVYYKSPTTTISGVTYTTAGESEGDGCPAANSVNTGMVGVAVDSYGNVFFADNGHRTIRVIYEGGAAVAQAIVNAQPAGTTLTTSNLQKGYVYLIVGSYTLESGTTTVAAAQSPYNCNQEGSGPLANPNNAALAGCPGGYATINPKGIAVDADGNVFFTTISGAGIEVLYVGGAKAKALILAAYGAGSAGTTKLTTVTPGYVYRIGGTTGSGYTADGSAGLSTIEDSPIGMFIDANENVIYADEQNNLVRKINGTTAIVSTMAGSCTGGTSSVGCESAYQLALGAGAGDGGPALSANFNYPYAVIEDSYGNLFIADSGINQPGVVFGRVRVVYAGGTIPGITGPVVGNIYTYAGGGTTAITNTPAKSIQFDEVEGLSIDASGYLYVTDHKSSLTTSNRIWRIDPISGIATVVVGTGGGALATATPPATVACGGVTPGPVHSDKYGSGCPGPQAYLNGPIGNLAFDKFGNGYLADSGNNLIREFSYNTLFPSTAVGASSSAQYVAFDVPSGTVTTGLGLSTNSSVSTDFTDAGITADSCTTAKTFTADTVCSFDLKFAPAAVGLRMGSVQLNSSTGTVGTQFLSGIGTASALTIDPGTTIALGSGITPAGVAVDLVGNAYLSDSKGKQVLKVSTAGGTATAIITGLGNPAQVAVDGQGTVYVADAGNNRIVRQTTGGVTTFLGTGLKAPQGVAVDYQGNVYVADTGNSRVVELGAITGIQTILNIDVATLNTPVSVTVDPSGNLYIVDKVNVSVVEVPATGGQQVLGLSGLLSPVALAVDAAGDLFVADSGSLNVLAFPVNATAGTTLIQGLISPVGLAADSAGSLYLADSGNASITAFNRTQSSIVFPKTDVKVTTFPSSTLTLTSAGNLSVSLGTPLYTETNPGPFPVTSPASGACSAGELLTPAASCQQTATFHPTAPGSMSSTVTFPSNGNTVTASLSGVATNLTTTSVSVVQTAPSTSTVDVGQSATISATVVPSTSTTQPSGTISITIDGGNATVQNLPATGNPTVSFTVTLGVGIHSVQACYSGDSTYAASCGTTTITVVLNPTSTALTASSTTVNGSAGIALTATITSATNSSAITGTVTFTNGTGANAVTLGTANVTNGVATLTAPITAASSNSFTACYGGSTVFAASCITISGTADFVVLPMVFPTTTPLTTSLGVPQGGQALANVTVVPLNGYTGTLTGSCSNMPLYSNCRFSIPAASITTPAAGASQTNASVSFAIYTGANPTIASLNYGSHNVWTAMMFGWPAAMLALFGIRRRKFVPMCRALLGIALLFGAVAGFSGCGSSTPAATYVTPAGTTNITVTLTDANNLSHSVTLPITVTP